MHDIKFTDKVLKPSDKINNVTMSTTVNITQDKSQICLHVTYFFKPNARNNSTAVRIEQLDKQAGSPETQLLLEQYSKPYWAKKRIKTDTLTAGEYNISLFIVPYTVFIGDINFCEKRRYKKLKKISKAMNIAYTL